MTKTDWSKIQGKRNFSVTSALLAICAVLYGLGVRLRLIAYGRKKKKSLPGFVVSIGNITVGGTGKTPATCMLAEWALGEGYRVAVLSRGYGGQYKSKVLEVSDGNDVKSKADEGGDEPYLMARKLQRIPVIVSKERYLAGIFAHKKFGSNFFVLDDGFQHIALKRDLDLVLIDVSNPFGNGHLLPWGPLREPLEQLKRADAFIITRSGHDGTSDRLMGDLEKEFPGKPAFRSDHIPEKVVFPSKRQIHNCEIIAGKRIMAFAGIARPDVFMETLAELGAELVLFRTFRDHHPFQHREIRDLMNEKRRLDVDYLLTTEKDWVRMEGVIPPYPDLGYLTVKFKLLSGEDTFLAMVKEKAEGIRESDSGVRSQGLKNDL
jgi:tetraacyldisaccharide 4'-kinase